MRNSRPPAFNNVLVLTEYNGVGAATKAATAQEVLPRVDAPLLRNDLSPARRAFFDEAVGARVRPRLVRAARHDLLDPSHRISPMVLGHQAGKQLERRERSCSRSIPRRPTRRARADGTRSQRPSASSLRLAVLQQELLHHGARRSTTAGVGRVVRCGVPHLGPGRTTSAGPPRRLMYLNNASATSTSLPRRGAAVSNKVEWVDRLVRHPPRGDRSSRPTLAPTARAPAPLRPLGDRVTRRWTIRSSDAPYGRRGVWDDSAVPHRYVPREGFRKHPPPVRACLLSLPVMRASRPRVTDTGVLAILMAFVPSEEGNT